MILCLQIAPSSTATPRLSVERRCLSERGFCCSTTSSRQSTSTSGLPRLPYHLPRAGDRCFGACRSHWAFDQTRLGGRDVLRNTLSLCPPHAQHRNAPRSPVRPKSTDRLVAFYFSNLPEGEWGTTRTPFSKPQEPS